MEGFIEFLHENCETDMRNYILTFSKIHTIIRSLAFTIRIFGPVGARSMSSRCHTKMESDGSSEAPPASEPPMMRRIVRSIALSWNPLFEARFGARLPKLEKPQRNLPYLREAEGARNTDFSCWWTVSWNKQIENQMTPRSDKKTILSFWDGSFSGANLLLSCLIAEGDVFVFTDSIYRGRSSPFLFHHHLAPTIVINGVVNGLIKWYLGF